VALFRRRTDHVDAGELAAYRRSLEANMQRIERACSSVTEIADDLRRRVREPDEVAEPLTVAEAELEEVAAVFAEQEAPEPLRALHAEFDANLERALRGIVTIERGSGLTRLPHATMYDDEPQAYWKRGHLNIVHAQVRMREIANVLFTWKAGTPAEATVSARVQQMEA
jgi:hypothetical protein